jgi:hypothetical protein
MSVREIEIVIRGRPGSGAFNAAHTAAQALEAAGVSVDLRSPLAHEEMAGDALRGVRALVKVEDVADSDTAQSTLLLTSGARTVTRTGLSDIAKVGIGVVLLLILFGAELRLHFGLRLDAIITVAGIWAFWHYCLRRQVAAK